MTIGLLELKNIFNLEIYSKSKTERALLKYIKQCLACQIYHGAEKKRVEDKSEMMSHYY